MASKAMGTAKQGDQIDVTVWHDPRDSYSRSVVPCAVRNVNRLGLWAGWRGYTPLRLVDGPDVAQAQAQGLTSSVVTFVRTA